MNITPDGEFSEIELALTVAELRKLPPEAEELIESTFGSTEDVVTEISLRRRELISTELALEDLWTEAGVFLEIQCPTGENFEVDPFGSMIANPDDDV